MKVYKGVPKLPHAAFWDFV